MTTPPLIIVPEFILQQGLVAVFNQIRTSTVPENTSYLYRLCNNLVFQRYNVYKEMKSLLLKDKSDPKYLDVDLMFNSSRSTPPSIHIVLAGDQNGMNGLGLDQYKEPFFEDNLTEDIIVSSSYQNVFNRRYKGTYDVVITTDNSTEAVCLFHIVRAVLTSLIPSFHLQGLQNISFSGQDLNPYSDLVPKGLFVKAIRVSLEYEGSTLQLEKQIKFYDLEVESYPTSD